MSILNKIKGGLFFVLLSWQLSGQAQDVKMFSGKAPSAAEMGDILFAQPGEAPGAKSGGIKMRSISFGKPKKAQDAEPVALPKTQKSSSVGLPIKFEYNSASVLAESKPFLDEIGKMLSMPNFSNEKLVIEGHTDAGGSENYNRHLSERRADAVKNYLENKFNIVESRLFVTGMGESNPLPGVDPYSPVNRRVQFRRAP